jgi:terminase small subunit / prophage DNA-packing protein
LGGFRQLSTQTECADWLDLSERRFRELIDAGVISRAEKSQYDVKAVVQQYVRHIREVAAGRGGGESQIDKAVEEARRMSALADKAELDVAQIRGELVPADAIADVLHTAIQVMKTRITAVPAKAAPLVGARNVAVAEKVIREHIHEALADLATIQVVGAPARSE